MHRCLLTCLLLGLPVVDGRAQTSVQTVRHIEWKGAAVRGAAFSPDGELVATITEFGEVRVRDAQSWDVVCAFEIGHRRGQAQIAFVGDLLGIRRGGSFEAYDAHTGLRVRQGQTKVGFEVAPPVPAGTEWFAERVRRASGATDAERLIVAARGERAISIDGRGRAQRWFHDADGELGSAPIDDHGEWITHLAMSGDGQWLHIAGPRVDFGFHRVCGDTRNTAVVRVPSERATKHLAFAFGAAAEFAIVEARRIRIFDPGRGEVRREFTTGEDFAAPVGIVADRSLLFAKSDWSLRHLDLDDGRLRSLPSPGAAATPETAVATPDHSRLIVGVSEYGSGPGSYRPRIDSFAFDADASATISAYPGFPITSLELLADGTELLAGGESGIARLDARTLETLAYFETPTASLGVYRLGDHHAVAVCTDAWSLIDLPSLAVVETVKSQRALWAPTANRAKRRFAIATLGGITVYELALTPGPERESPLDPSDSRRR